MNIIYNIAVDAEADLQEFDASGINAYILSLSYKNTRRTSSLLPTSSIR